MMKGVKNTIHNTENKILRTKKDIEQEFKDLKFIHQHEPGDNNSTIFEHSSLNGSFNENVIISLSDDLFINFPHELFIPHSLGEFWQFYSEHENKCNIFIDSRSVVYIAYAVIKYADDVLIYDVYNSSCVSVYAFCSKFFNIQTNEITVSQIKSLFVSYLLLAVYVKSLGFEWNTPSVIKSIKHIHSKVNNGEGNLNIFDVLIDYCKVKTSSDTSTKNIRYIISLFEEYFGENAYNTTKEENNINPLSEWKLTGITPYEFLVSLTLLKNNGFHIQYIQ